MLIRALLSATLLLPLTLTNTLAQKTVQGLSLDANVTVASDYRFRGISQNGENPAIQGGFDLVSEENWYAGVWGSNISGSSTIEMDFYAGINFEKNNVGYDLGIIYYLYPDESELSYLEFAGSLAVNDLSLGLIYSNDYYAGTGQFFYPSVDYSMPLSDEVDLSFHVGYSFLLDDDPGFFDDNTSEYLDWSIGVSTEAIDNAIWALTLVGTDVDDGDTCYGNKSLCGLALVLSLSKSF